MEFTGKIHNRSVFNLFTSSNSAERNWSKLYSGYYKGNGLIIKEVKFKPGVINELFLHLNITAVEWLVYLLNVNSNGFALTKLNEIYTREFTRKELNEVLNFFRIQNLVKVLVSEEYPYGLIVPQKSLKELLIDAQKEC